MIILRSTVGGGVMGGHFKRFVSPGGCWVVRPDLNAEWFLSKSSDLSATGGFIRVFIFSVYLYV